VPEGADTAHLGLALLAPGEELLDHGGEGDVWLALSGYYNDGSNLFSVALQGLTAAGRTLVLFESPDVETLSLPAAAARAPAVPGFNVTCHRARGATGCPPADEGLILAELASAYADFTSLGFKPPALQQHVVTVSTLFHGVQPAGTFYDIDVHYSGSTSLVCALNPIDGQYDPKTMALDLCVTPADPQFRDVLRHELFHATQFAYRPFYKSVPQKHWLREGTASAASRSGAHPLQRFGGWNVRAVDVSLELSSSLFAYEAQDFWVFFGRHIQEGLSMLIPIFQAGAQTADVNDNLQSPTLAQAYWLWAKNQVFEKNDDLGVLGNPCEYNPQAVKAPYVYKIATVEDTASGILTPLTSALVEVDSDFATIVLDAHAPWPSPAPIGHPLDDDVHFKIYQEGDDKCEALPEDTKRQLDDADSKKIYVLVTNTSLTKVKNFGVFIHH
jgi:hypothetical protein